MIGFPSGGFDKLRTNSPPDYQLCQKLCQLCQPPLPQLGALCQPFPQPPFPQPPLPQLCQLCQPPLCQPQPPLRQPNPPLIHSASRTPKSGFGFFCAMAFISETPARISRSRSATTDADSEAFVRSGGSACVNARAEEIPSTPAGRSIASALLVVRRTAICASQDGRILPHRSLLSREICDCHANDNQPPFARVEANGNFPPFFTQWTLQDGFGNTADVGNYAINRNYRLPYVRVWYLDLERSLPLDIVLDAGYIGSKGTRLDVAFENVLGVFYLAVVVSRLVSSYRARDRSHGQVKRT